MCRRDRVDLTAPVRSSGGKSLAIAENASWPCSGRPVPPQSGSHVTAINAVARAVPHGVPLTVIDSDHATWALDRFAFLLGTARICR